MSGVFLLRLGAETQRAYYTRLSSIHSNPTCSDSRPLVDSVRRLLGPRQSISAQLVPSSTAS